MLAPSRVTGLAAMNRELEAFSYPVSADLRAPLRSIDGLHQHPGGLQSAPLRHTSSVRKSAMEPVSPGIGRRINFAISTGFAAVLLVGGISVFLAWAMSVGVEEARERILEVQALDRIRGSMEDFVSDLHLVLQGGRAAGRQPPEAVFDELKTRIATYEALERVQGGDEASRELVQLEALRSLLAQVETVSLAVIGASERGRALVANRNSALTGYGLPRSIR